MGEEKIYQGLLHLKSPPIYRRLLSQNLLKAGKSLGGIVTKCLPCSHNYFFKRQDVGLG